MYIESAEPNYVFCGCRKYVASLLRIFPKAAERVRFFIGEESAGMSGGLFFGFRVLSADEAGGEDISGALLVVEDGLNTAEKRALGEEYGVDFEHILTDREWIISLLRDPEVQLIPDRIRLDICTLCQLDCTACYMRRDAKQTTGMGFVDPEQFIRLLDQNPQIREVEISNSGEPFLHPNMHELIRAAHERHVCLSCWNGANFNDVSDTVLRDIAECGFGDTAIALDGASQETYGIYRRKGNFDKVILNIRKLNAFKREYHTEYPHLTWQFIMMSHNVKEMDKAREMAKELGMKISFLETWDEREREKTRMLLKEMANQPQNEAKQIRDGGGVLPGLQAEELNTFSAYCKDLLFYPQINWDGRLLGCCQVYRSDFGLNVFEEGLVPVMNSDKYRSTLIALLDGSEITDGSVPCRTCFIRPVTEEERAAIIKWD